MLQVVRCLMKIINAVLLRLQACAQALELRKDVPHPMRFFTALAELLNDRVVDHALRLDKMRKGLGRVDGITRDALVWDHGGPYQFFRWARRQSQGGMDAQFNFLARAA